MVEKIVFSPEEIDLIRYGIDAAIARLDKIISGLDEYKDIHVHANRLEKFQILQQRILNSQDTKA